MRVLVACEESQAVCTEFRMKGHEAYSCDIIECSGGHPEWHIRQDVLPLLNGNCEFTTDDGFKHKIDGKWDLIIAHPPCTYLSNAATRSFSLRMTPAEKVVARWEERAKATIFFMQMILADCDRIAVENPIGFMNGAYRKPDQIIQPYFFAKDDNDVENYQMKTTCLWLKGLPKLQRTNELGKPHPVYIRDLSDGRTKNVYFVENHGKIGGMKRNGNDSAARSKTFPGVAKAMADQWG